MSKKLTAEQKDSRTRIVNVSKNLIQITISEEAAKDFLRTIDEDYEYGDEDDPDALDGLTVVEDAIKKGVKQIKNNRASGWKG